MKESHVVGFHRKSVEGEFVERGCDGKNKCKNELVPATVT